MNAVDPVMHATHARVLPPPPRLPADPTANGGSAALRLMHCGACDLHFAYPRQRCPQCGSLDLVPRRASGRARLCSSIAPIAAGIGPDGRHEPARVFAVVELEEGVRMMSALVGLPPAASPLAADTPLEVVFEAHGDEMLPRFRRADR